MGDLETANGGGNEATANHVSEPEPAANEGAAQGAGSSRRDFLIGATFASVAGVGAVYVPRYLGGTRIVPSAAARSARPVWLAAASAAGPTQADWTALRNKLSTHRLLRPGQPGYQGAKELFEQRFDSLKPAGLAFCRTAADVAACISFVTAFKLPVRARSGGHSYAGWSSVTGGLVIDVSEMNSFSVGTGTVTVGTGIDLINLYDKLAAHGLAVPGGSCPTVGIAGLTLGGGIGVLSRAFGLTCDNLESLKIVTADGSVLTCNSTHNSDLYWASRGGGGGNFGVATSFTFRAHKLTKLAVFFLSWPWSQAGRVVRAWQSWAPHAPDALWSNLHLSSAFGGSPVLSVGGTYTGTVAGLDRLLGDLYARAGKPATQFVAEESYLNAMLLEAGCSSIPVHACHTGQGGQLPRVPSYAKSDFFTSKLNDAGITALLGGIERLHRIRGARGGVGSVAFDACGGAMNRVPPRATAFVHRNALFLAQYSTVWPWPGSATGVRNQHRWLISYYKSVHPHASGKAYQNYIDPGLTGWQSAYYGVNYQRLQQVKSTYDPHQVFTFPQAIRPA